MKPVRTRSHLQTAIDKADFVHRNYHRTTDGRLIPIVSMSGGYLLNALAAIYRSTYLRPPTNPSILQSYPPYAMPYVRELRRRGTKINLFNFLLRSIEVTSKPVTPWYDMDQWPERSGVYQKLFPNGSVLYSWWEDQMSQWYWPSLTIDGAVDAYRRLAWIDCPPGPWRGVRGDQP